MPESAEAIQARIDRLVSRFDAALQRLAEAPPFAKARYQEDAFGTAGDLLDTDEGMRALLERAGSFETVGLFHGGPWENAASLVPDLVGVGLTGEGVYPTVESLSELRMIAVACGQAPDSRATPEGARRFLEEVCAKCIHLMFPTQTEESRRRPKLYARAARLLQLVCAHIPTDAFRDRVIEEVELLCAQRPILTERIRAQVENVSRLEPDDPAAAAEMEEHIAPFRAALGPATELALEAGDPIVYRDRIARLELDALMAEAGVYAKLMQNTGLSSPYHAVLVRKIARVAPERVGVALGVSAAGQAEASRSADLVAQLVRQSIVPHTARVLYGLAGVLERGVTARTEVAGGLRRIAEMAIRPDVAEKLIAPYPDSSGLTANAVLLGGCISVLGQPLGIGQGNNPTCQSARGISLWSLHAPGLLLGMVASAARDGFIATNFEGAPLRSDQLAEGIARGRFDPELDPVSQVVVPHLDRIYSAMMTHATLRGEDAHRWVNPEMYGRWVPHGFASAFAVGSSAVQHHETFVRRFYATHHPDYNDGHELIYPNPVGLIITSSSGKMLGPHAVSLQRVGISPQGELRCYFFNPNNEGRQDWGEGVQPTVAGHGEIPGESSLPFAGFTSRLYAFHYDPQEEGDAFAVPSELIAEVHRMAKETWGRDCPSFQ